MPTSAIDIREITVDQARVVRDTVLRPNFAPGGSIYPHDDDPDTLHVGAFVDGVLAAVATVCREPMPGEFDGNSWRLRGMATLLPFRSRGLSKKLAQECFEHVVRNCGALIWCTARASSVSFYSMLGFSEEGQLFRLPEYSDAEYILMRRPLRAAMGGLGYF